MTQFSPMVDEPQTHAPPVTEETGSRFGKAHHILLIFAGAALLVWLLSGIYKVNPGEVAIIERLGEYVGSGNGGTGKAMLIEPGPHYALPWPIDRVHKISIHQTRILTVNIFNSQPDAYAEAKRRFVEENPGINLTVADAVFDPYLITADKDVVHMEVAVQYTIADPEAWLTTASHEDDITGESEGMREALFQQVVQHAMVHMVSHLTIDDMLFEGRQKLPDLLKTAVVNALELPDLADPAAHRIDMGIHVERVDLVDARPPAVVQPWFDKVTQARAQMVSDEQKAQADARAAVTQADAAAQAMISDANAYQAQVVQSAKGEAARFAQVLKQYEQAPEVTRYNVYVDAVRTVAAAANRLMFMQPGQHATITIDSPQFDANQVRPGNPAAAGQPGGQ
ncbi:MAG TPA: protease modulator HflK [Phycisphaerae bacterium]|nr:protease modulator HflK [Phycisphaerae bacterium]